MIDISGEPDRFDLTHNTSLKWTLMRSELIRLGAISVVLLSTMAAEAQTQLFPAFREEKWGYVDSGRRFVIEPKFELAGPFVQGLAPVKSEGKYGYIDLKGNWRIDPRFLTADAFSEGLSAVKDENGYGYIDTAGEMIIRPQVEWAGPFHQDRAVVFVNQKYGYIDTKGVIVIKAQFKRARPFSEEMAAVSLDGERFGYINREGNEVVQSSFRGAGEFHEGLAWIEDLEGGFGIINKSGKIVNETKFSGVKQFRGGFAAVREDNSWKIVDRDGKVRDDKFDGIDDIEIFPNHNVAARKGSTIYLGELDDKGFVDFQVGAIDRNLKNVAFESKPVGAMIYTPTIWEYEHTLDKKDLLNENYYISSGKTNVIGTLRVTQVYMIMFRIGKKLRTLRCVPAKDDKVSATF